MSIFTLVGRGTLSDASSRLERSCYREQQFILAVFPLGCQWPIHCQRQEVCVYVRLCVWHWRCVDVGTFGTRLLSVLQPLLHWRPSPSHLVSVSNGSSKTILPVKCQENYHGINAHTLFTVPYSLPAFCLSISPSCLAWLCLMPSQPPFAAACLSDPVVVSFRTCLLVIRLHYLCCIVFHHQFPQWNNWDRFPRLSQ